MILHRKLGNTGIKVSEIGFGAWAVGGHSYGAVQDSVSIRALECALEEGVSLIDTADVYGNGHSEKLISQVSKHHREKMILATKAGWDFYHGSIRQNYDRSYIEFALDESLERLKTDTIDLFQLHNPPKELALNGDLLNDLENLCRSGKIRSYGVSVHGPEEACYWLDHTNIQVIQIAFSLLDQRPIKDLFLKIKERGCGLIAREPLACGMLTEKYRADAIFPKNDHRRRWPKEKLEMDLEKIKKIKSLLYASEVPLSQLALEFVLSFSEVSVVIPGAKTPEQAKANIKASSDKYLNSEVIEKIKKLYREDEIFLKGLYKN